MARLDIGDGFLVKSAANFAAARLGGGQARTNIFLFCSYRKTPI
jgi:hypothetical protein